MFENLTTRRIFLQRGLTLLAVTPTIPTFLDQTVLAMADPLDLKRTQQLSGKDGKILVVVQLGGGNDGLNTVIPFSDDAYHNARPALAHAPDAIHKINDYIGLHPNLAPLKELYENGRMSIVQGVGYPNPNRSHFRSMDIWHSGQPEKEIATSGWLGRYFDNACAGCDPSVGVSLGEQLPLAMQGEKVRPLSFDRPENYRYNGQDLEKYLALNKKEATTSPVLKPKNRKDQISATGELDFLHRTAMDAQISSDEILRVTKRHKDAAEYPGGKFGEGLRTVAAMIGGGLPTRVYYVSLTGFDTHANQRGRHDNLMQQLAQGVSAFWSDLKTQGNDDRVLMMTFSEFGRRVAQNASNGTDHGAAAPMFLFGPNLKTGIFGGHPSLIDLDQGDLRYGVDFRNVYATILQSWLETPSKPVFGQQFKTLPLLKA